MKKNYQEYKTIQQIAEELGIKPELPFDVSMLEKEQQNYLNACYWLPIITKFFNEGKPFDYRRGNNQPKWFTWPDVEASDELPSGFGLSNPYTFYDDEGSSVGSRLCSFDSSVTLHVMKHFNDLYVDLNLIKED